MSRITKKKRDFPKIRSILQQSTIHGFNIIGFDNITMFERIFFVIIVSVATFSAGYLILSHLQRFSADPTVVSIQKDFRNWENPFPAATGCLRDKVDLNKAETYIFEMWNLQPTDGEKYEYYLNFTRAVANITLTNVEEIMPFIEDQSLNNINLLKLVSRVHPTLFESLVFQNQKDDKWRLIMTELGVCFTFNSQFANILSKGIDVENASYGVNTEPSHCHYLNGICYARYDSDPTIPVMYYVHSHLDVIHTSSGTPLTVHQSEELEVNFRMIETTSSKNIRSLSPKQRKCRFSDEPLTNDISVYSTSICYLICRYKLTMQLCGCKPLFYGFLEGNTCTLKQMKCLKKHSKVLSQSPLEMKCKCPQPCHLITYLKERVKNTKWEAGYFDQRITFRWGLLPPTTKYRRDVLYGLGDLIVSLGGTLTLFLGVSFISIIELIFLIVEKICLG